MAMLNRKEMELSDAQKELKNLQAQLRAMAAHITELKKTREQLCAQVRYLTSKWKQNA